MLRGNDECILNDIDPDNKKSDSIKEFNKYFTKFLNNVDRNLKRGIKINYIKKEGDKISNPPTNMPIKNAIIHYLPVLIIYGNKEQIFSLKNHINKMLTLVKKNDEFDLNVSSIIFDIYKDIEDFLHLNKYMVTEQRWRVKFSISNELLMVVGVTLSIVYKVLEFLISIYSK